jgi:hypothetical protein
MFTLHLPDIGPDDQELACNALANTLACSLDEALLGRVGAFSWRSARTAEPAPPLHAVPSNRYDRAALHLWHEVLAPRGIAVPPDEARALADLLDDCFKVASRLHGGKLWPMMQASVWRGLHDRLQDDLGSAAEA